MFDVVVAQGQGLTELTSLYVLGQVFFILRETMLVDRLGWALVQPQTRMRRLLVSLILRPSCTLAACFLLAAVLKNPALSSRLLEKARLLPFSIDRQNALLSAVLGDVAVGSTDDEDEARDRNSEHEQERQELLTVLLNMLGNTEISVLATQAMVLVVKAITSNVTSPLSSDHMALLRQSYVRCSAPLKERLRSDSSEQVCECVPVFSS